MRLSRRRFLIASGASATLALWPRTAAWGAPGGADPRLLVVLLRGGLDGLHALPPLDDPDAARLRAALLPDAPLPLDGSFGLHPALGFAHTLYQRGDLLPVVAVAPPYRERSHFDAQDCLENGTGTPGGSHTGWLNRCVGAMGGAEGLAIASVMPLSLRGPAPARTWSPPLPQAVDPRLLERLAPLYAADPELATAFEQVAAGSLDAMAGESRRVRGRLPDLAGVAARFLAAARGPRVGFVEDSGWDTHGSQARVLGRKLAELDAALEAFHDAARAVWPSTVVVVLTEFGRTVAINGTGGTDHGTGGLALLAGGPVAGGRIGGDWPGLGVRSLYEGRDLRPTGDLRGLLKGVLGQHLRVSEAALETQVFPDSRSVPRMEGLIG